MKMKMKMKEIKPFLVKRLKKPLYECMTEQTSGKAAGLTRTGQWVSVSGYWREAFAGKRFIRFRPNVRFERYIGTKGGVHVELASFDVYDGGRFAYSLWLFLRCGEWHYLGKDGSTTGPYGVSDFWRTNEKAGIDPVSILDYV